MRGATAQIKARRSGKKPRSVISAVVKDALNESADNLDTTNRIIEETTAIQNEIHETISNAASAIAKSVVKSAVNVGKWIIKMGTKP